MSKVATRRRVGQPGGGTDIEGKQPAPRKGGARLAAGGHARIFPVVGGEADRSRASMVAIPADEGVEVVVRHLDPGDYLAVDESGNERLFTVDAGREDAVVQPGRGRETTGPGGSVVQEVESHNVGQVTNGLPAGTVPTEVAAAAQKVVKPKAALADNLGTAAVQSDAPTKPPRNDPNNVGASVKAEDNVPGALKGANREQKREAAKKKPAAKKRAARR